MLALAILLLAIAAQQLWFLSASAPEQPVGDEQEYLRRMRLNDPHTPAAYLRVPLFLVIGGWLARGFAESEAAWRWINAATAVLAAGATMVAAMWLGGAQGLWLSGMFLLLLAERFILARHLWPDTLLSLFNALLLLLLLIPPSLTIHLMLGAILALAALTRIEQLALLPGVLVVLALTPGEIDPLAYLAVTLPTLLALLTWSWIAHRRYGIWWPDTTWMFNLQLSREELTADHGTQVCIEPIVLSFHRRWLGMSPHERSAHLLDWVWKHPLRVAQLTMSRFLAFWGPDTIVSDRLLPPIGRAYRSMRQKTAARYKCWLQWSFPIISLTCLWAILVVPPAGIELLPGLFLFGATIAAHFRTRYRITLVPWLVAIGSDSLARLDVGGLGIAGWLLLLALYAVAYRLVRMPPRLEQPRAAIPPA